MDEYYPHYGNAKNYIMDANSMIQRFESKMIEVIKKDVRMYRYPRDEIEKIAWLIAMAADEVKYNFGNENTKIFKDPVEIDNNSLEEHLPRDYNISEDDFTRKISPILYDLKVLCNNVMEEIEKQGINENEEHTSTTYLELKTLEHLSDY